MEDVTPINPGHAALADNSMLMPSNLPPANTVRWVARRKAEVVDAVHAGALTKAEACRRYCLSPQELREWELHYKADGVDGLRVCAHHRRPRALH